MLLYTFGYVLAAVSEWLCLLCVKFVFCVLRFLSKVMFAIYIIACLEKTVYGIMLDFCRCAAYIMAFPAAAQQC